MADVMLDLSLLSHLTCPLCPAGQELCEGVHANGQVLPTTLGLISKRDILPAT